MNQTQTIKRWFNRHLGFELAALLIALIVMVRHSALERIQALRFGSHIDAVTICVTVAIIVAVIGLLLPAKSGESKRLAFAVFVLTFLVFFLGPAFLPAK
jgi:hypothetical protein